jgi:hypothetical protein
MAPAGLAAGATTRFLTRHADRLALALLAAAALYRLLLIARGWPAIDSDEAIIGLMARHILTGDRPIWFWGQHYMGAFQAYFAALFFAVFGSSAFVLHLSVLLLTLGFLACVYLLGRAAYGPIAGLLTLGWLTFGPPMGVLRELMATGGYQDVLLFSALVLLGVWLRLRVAEPVPRGRRAWISYLLTYAGIGLFAGLGLWSDLLILPVLVVAGMTLVAVRRRELLHAGGAVLLLAFVAGGYPYISFNIAHQNLTYTDLVHQTHPRGHSGSLPALPDWQAQTGEMLAVAVPTLLGSPHVCVNRGNIWGNYPPTMAETTSTAGGLCDDANVLLSLAAITVYVLVAWPLLLILRRWLSVAWQRLRNLWARLRGRVGRAPPARKRRRRSTRATAGASVADPARLWLRFMLLGVAGMTVLAYSTSYDAQRYQFTSARYLLPLYLTAPLLIGFLWERSADAFRALAARWRRPRGGSDAIRQTARVRTGALTAAGALVVLLALSLYGGTLTLAHALDSRSYALPMPPADSTLLAYLDAHHITSFYGDYWTCYRLAFETHERLTCAVRGQNGDVGLELINNRYDPYIARMATVPNPAYILPPGTPEDAHFAAEAAQAGLPYRGYQRTVVAGYAIYYPPQP